MQKILFVINPFSGRKTGEHVKKIIQNKFNNYFPDIQYDIYTTKPNQQIIEFKNNYDLIIAVGGDGTASIVIKSILQYNTTSAFSIIPIGVGNDLARELGLYIKLKNNKLKSQIFNILKTIILHGEKIYFDVFYINGIQMINYFSIGYDAYILHKFDFYRKKLNKFIFFNFQNKILYVLLGIIFFYKKLPPKTEIIANNISLFFEHPLKNIIITNINSYASGSKISNTTKINDAYFEITIIKNFLDYLLLMLTRLKPSIFLTLFLKKVYQTRAKKVKITTPQEISLQIDGEAIEQKTNTIEINLLGKIEIIKRRY